ncbi:MAG: hypothetical protein ACL7BU_08625 [Candidatus Phlomobacter fragariae]
MIIFVILLNPEEILKVKFLSIWLKKKKLNLNKSRDFKLESPARIFETLLFEITGKGDYLIKLVNNGFMLLGNNEINFSKAMHTLSYLYHKLDQSHQVSFRIEVAKSIFLLGFIDSQLNLSNDVLKNMVTPELIVYSNKLYDAAEYFIILKKYSFY